MFLEISQKFTWKQLCFIKKRLWHSCFPVNFAKFLRTTFLPNTSGRLLLFYWMYYQLWIRFYKMVYTQVIITRMWQWNPYESTVSKLLRSFCKHKVIFHFYENSSLIQHQRLKWEKKGANIALSKPAFICSKLTIETLVQSVKYVQS